VEDCACYASDPAATLLVNELQAVGGDTMNYLLQDLRHGLRVYAKRPVLTLIAVITLALGIGASGATFGVVNAILLKPLGFPKAQQIVIPWRRVPPGMNLGYDEIPWGNNQVRALEEHPGVFQSIGAFKPESFNLTGEGDPVLVDGLRVTSGFFSTLGVPPSLGATFSERDDQPGSPPKVVLSYELWRAKFSAEKNIVGRTINLSSESYTVIGVMPKGFDFPRANEMPGSFSFPRAAQLWVPLVLPLSSPLTTPDELAVVARLSEHATIAQAQAQMNVFARSQDRQWPILKGWFNARVVPLRTQVVGDTRLPLQLILAAVGLVLLIVCANIASVLLSQSISRSAEFSTRLALGAPKGRLFRQLLSETVLLSLIGGCIGAVLAVVGLSLIKAFGPTNVPRLQDASVDVLVILFGIGVTLLCGILVGLVPAISATRSSLIATINQGNQRNIGGGRSALIRNVIVISEIALALVLSVSAGLFFRTFTNLLGVNGGFRPESVLTFELSLPGPQYADRAKVVSTYRAVLEKLQTAPGVIAAGIGETAPLGGAGESTAVRIPDHPAARPSDSPVAGYTIVSPGYFRTLDTPVILGRSFQASDDTNSRSVTVINEAMAQAFWPGENPIGRQVILKTPLTIVGVVANIKQQSLREDTGPEMYVPYTQNPWPSMLIMQAVVRVHGDPHTAFAQMRAAVHAIDPDLPLARMVTLSETVDRSLAAMHFVVLSVAAFGGLALILACVGIYGVVSFSVARRTREIGIRMALGAPPRQVFSLILRQGIYLTLAGLGIGMILSLIAGRLTGAFLYGVPELDPVTYLTTCGLLIAVTMVATGFPALRAMRIDPMVAFRHE